MPTTSTLKPELVRLENAGRVRQQQPPPGARPHPEGRNSCTRGATINGAGKIEIIQPPDHPNDTILVHFHGGAQILNPSLQLIFWGNAWNNPVTSPTAGQVMAAVQNILSGPYMTRLDQYGIGPGTLRGGTTVLSDPPNPFSKDDWHNLVWNLIDQGTFPEPSAPGGRILYMIIPPPLVVYEDAGVCGIHGYPWDFDLSTGYTKAWAGFALNDGTLDTITANLSHEVVEACTDPEDDGWLIEGRSPPDDEICDVCQNTVALVDGVLVMGYWSVQHDACIIPLAPRQTIWQVSCINKTPRTDIFHSMTHVGGIDGNGNPYRFTRDQVIGMIKEGHSFFVGGSDGSQSEINVFLHYPPGSGQDGLEYIATGPDHSKLDNLLSLPECP